jgi:hypothetical protein
MLTVGEKAGLLVTRALLSLKLFFFRDRVSLCSPGCPGTHSVDQAGLKLRNLPASASDSRVLGLKACATTPGSPWNFLWWLYGAFPTSRPATGATGLRQSPSHQLISLGSAFFFFFFLNKIFCDWIVWSLTVCYLNAYECKGLALPPGSISC